MKHFLSNRRIEKKERRKRCLLRLRLSPSMNNKNDEPKRYHERLLCDKEATRANVKSIKKLKIQHDIKG